jgi:hypothetical protein
MSEIANSSFDTAAQENTTVWLQSLHLHQAFNRQIASQAPIAPEDPEKPPVETYVDEILPLEKQALMLRRTGWPSNCSGHQKSFDVYGTDGFGEFKSKKITAETLKYKNSFQIVTALKLKGFDQAYDNSKKEFANFQLGTISKISNRHEFMKNMSALRMDVTRRSNMAGTLKTGDD